MPRKQSSDDAAFADLPLMAHLDANFLALHYLKLKLRHMIKTATEPEDHLVASLRVLSDYLPTAKMDIDRLIARLEKRYANLRRQSTH